MNEVIKQDNYRSTAYCYLEWFFKKFYSRELYRPTSQDMFKMFIDRYYGNEQGIENIMIQTKIMKHFKFTFAITDPSDDELFDNILNGQLNLY